MVIRLHADFNGLFGELLCNSHSDAATDEHETAIRLAEGMHAIAFEEDVDDEGRSAFLVARGEIVRSPTPLVHAGSRWCLRIDAQGVRHVATLCEA